VFRRVPHATKPGPVLRTRREASVGKRAGERRDRARVERGVRSEPLGVRQGKGQDHHRRELYHELLSTGGASGAAKAGRYQTRKHHDDTQRYKHADNRGRAEREEKRPAQVRDARFPSPDFRLFADCPEQLLFTTSYTTITTVRPDYAK
jgi:hypothetical protein